jgi:hypothetical protein
MQAEFCASSRRLAAPAAGSGGHYPHASRAARRDESRAVYVQGIDSGEIIATVDARRAPVIPVSASPRLYSVTGPARC